MDKQWEMYLNWRIEKGLTGLSIEEQYNEFLTQVEQPSESTKLTKQEATNLEGNFKDVHAKGNELATFKAIEDKLAQGVTMTFDELAELTAQSSRTVKRHVDALEEKGLLHVKRGKHANAYYYGVDMRADKKVKFKNVCIVDLNESASSEDIIEEHITIVETDEVEHVTVYNANTIMERCTEEYSKAEAEKEYFKLLGEFRNATSSDEHKQALSDLRLFEKLIQKRFSQEYLIELINKFE